MSSRDGVFSSNFLINGRPYKCIVCQQPDEDFYTIQLIGCKVGSSDIPLPILIEIFENEYFLILNTSLSEKDIFEDLKEISEEDIILSDKNIKRNSNLVFKSQTSDYYTEVEERGGSVKPVHKKLRG